MELMECEINQCKVRISCDVATVNDCLYCIKVGNAIGPKSTTFPHVAHS